MKQTFIAINVGDITLTQNEVIVKEALSLAKLNPNLLEQQLSAFLSYSLDDNELPYNLTVQQRYYCLLQYLACQKDNDLAVNVNVNEYLIDEHKEWKHQVVVEGVTVRQLTGLEIEALELIAQGLDDWLVGAMALQISFGADFPYIQPLTDRRHAAKVLKSRYDLLISYGQEKLNDLHRIYSEAEDQLASLLYTGFDNKGVVLFKANGGNDSEPARFQCDTAFYGFTKQLFSALVEGGATPGQQLGDASE